MAGLDAWADHVTTVAVGVNGVRQHEDQAVSYFDEGDPVRVSARFFSTPDANVDPTGLVFQLLDPDAVATSYSYPADVQLVRVDTGRYHVDVVPAVPGVWRFRWTGTGSNAAAREGQFVVRPSDF